MTIKSTHEERIEIGKLLKSKQNALNLSNKDVEKEIGLTYAGGFSAWKSGACIPFKYAEKLSKFLDIPLEYFPDSIWQKNEDADIDQGKPRERKIIARATNKIMVRNDKAEILVTAINKLSQLSEMQLLSILAIIAAFHEEK